MGSPDVPMINTQSLWEQPRTSLMPVRAFCHTSFVHMPNSRNRTLPQVHSGVHHRYRSLWFDPRRPSVRSSIGRRRPTYRAGNRPSRFSSSSHIAMTIIILTFCIRR
jgi:hypothetical protein